MDLIMSVGCSFQMGLALNFHRWEEKGLLKNGKLDDDHTWMGMMSLEDHQFMQKNNYTGLVAKELGTDVYGSQNYGCGNDELLKWSFDKIDLLQSRDVFKSNWNVKLFIIQLTDPFRDFTNENIESRIEVCKRLGIEDFPVDTNIELKREMHKFDKFCKWYEKELLHRLFEHIKSTLNCPLLVWTWQPEFQKTAPKENRVWFEIDGTEHRYLDSALNQKPLQVSDVIEGVSDMHPNLKCHKIIAENILRVYYENFT